MAGVELKFVMDWKICELFYKYFLLLLSAIVSVKGLVSKFGCDITIIIQKST